MPHFSRLTDIITCSISEILSSSPEPLETLREIIDEMNEGLAACRRNIRTAMANSDRLRTEIAGYENQIVDWKDKARAFLGDGDEEGARESLLRKVEIEDLIEGLRPELDAALATSQHMQRIQKALDARHSEAVRKLEDLTGETSTPRLESEATALSAGAANKVRITEVEAELEALKRELNG